MEDKDAIITDLKSELYDNTKELQVLQSFLDEVASRLHLVGNNVTFEGILGALPK